MSFIGNFFWLIFGGLLSAILWVIGGVFFAITIIGLPFAAQCFKIAGFTLLPFGKEVTIGEFGAGGLLGNILWIIFFGWELCLIHIFLAFLSAITIIGIPFATQHIKLARLSLLPFGARIRY